MQNSSNLPEIRQFLYDSFSDEELSTLCFDFFPEVHDNFTTGMTKQQKILMLLEYCQHREIVANLLAAIQRARPGQYEKRFPQAPKAEARPEPARAVRDPKQVFISHAHEDAEFAHQLANDLQQRGWRVWIAPDNIRPGEKWVEAVNRGLDGSGVFVLVLTPAAVRSRWVKDETNVAIELEHEGRLKLIPLDVEHCDVPSLWRAYQRVSFRDRYEDGLALLFSELGQARKPPQRKPGAPPQRPTGTASKKNAGDAGKAMNLRVPPRILPMNPPATRVAKKKKFFEESTWWISLAVFLFVSIGGAFLADWLLRWSVGLFHAELRIVEGGWLALLITGLAWGLTYAFVGAAEANEPSEFFFAFLEPYTDIFDGIDLGDRLRGLLTAVPLNILISWGIAHGLAWATATFLNAAYNGIAFLVIGALTLVSISWRVASL